MSADERWTSEQMDHMNHQNDQKSKFFQEELVTIKTSNNRVFLIKKSKSLREYF